MATPYSNNRKQYARYSNVSSLEINATPTSNVSAKQFSHERTEQDKLMFSNYVPQEQHVPHIPETPLTENQELREFVTYHMPKQIVGLQEIKTLQEQVNFINSAPLCVIYLYGTNCEPCKIIGPQFEQLAQKYKDRPDVAFAKEDAHLFINKQVQGVPSFIIYKNGEQIAFYLGDFYKVEPTLEGELRSP